MHSTTKNAPEAGDRFAWVDDRTLSDLESLTRKLIDTGRSEVRLDGRSWPVYLPSGSKQYPAFWTRDAVWIAQSGLLDADALRSMTHVIAATQQGPEVRCLRHGLTVPAWSAADHIALADGGATFFPGTYATGDDHGNGQFGRVAAQDANYQFIEMAWLLAQAAGASALEERVRELPIIERLSRAFFAAEFDEATQLAKTTEATRAVAFSDAIVKTGALLEGSVLRWRSARRLSALWEALGDADAAGRYAQIAQTIEANLVPTFFEPTEPGRGWLLSATEIGRQCCVRGTCFALAFGAVRGRTAAVLAATLDAAAKEGQITHQGHVRHLRRGEYWQATPIDRDRYQNGGYWSMFAGWYWRALALVSEQRAADEARAFLDHLERHRFDRGEDVEHGAPYEWIRPDGFTEGAKYLAGLTLPYRALVRGFHDVPA